MKPAETGSVDGEDRAKRSWPRSADRRVREILHAGRPRADSTVRAPGGVGRAWRCAWLWAFVVLAGCATAPVAPNAAQLEVIRARVENQFARALYLKPAANGTVPERVRQLAPLLLIEVPAANEPVPWQNSDAPAEVIFQTDRVMLNGRWHERMTYWWRYRPNGRASRKQLPAQGVRLTLNTAGLPAIWEALADTTGAQVIFVSQNLEAGAVREFGAPPPGRRFAVERAPTEAPAVVVARVLEDGPVAMGPIVYLRAGTRDIGTVICRCMDSQARELAGQREYELRAAPAGARPPRFPATPADALRLPAGF